MCDGEKRQNNGSRCVFCVKRGAACGFLKCWVCVCRNTHKNSNGDLGRYAAPAVPAMKTLLGRNCCPLAGFAIGKQNLQLVVLAFQKRGKNKCLTGRKIHTTDCYLKSVKLTLFDVVCHSKSGNLQKLQMQKEKKSTLNARHVHN
jgi:hypothetical protein